MEPVNAGLRRLNLGKPLPERVENIENQVDLHTIIFDSEAGTRARAHAVLHARLDKQDATMTAQDKRLMRIERTLYVVGGALAVLQWLYNHGKL